MTRARFPMPQRLLLVVALACVGSTCSSPPPERPSIIFIMVDTLRADYLGSYGFLGDISPSLDRLAAESVVFENALTQAPWTKPAIASLFTSTYPRVHKLTDHDRNAREQLVTGILADEFTTLAESLSQAGYRTAAFVANPWVAKQHGFAQGFDVFDDRHAGRSLPADVILRLALDWLADQPDTQPFFLYLHFMDVHDPYDAPGVDMSALRGSPSLGRERRLATPALSYMTTLDATAEQRQSLAFWRTRYAANVRNFDRRLSFFLDSFAHSDRLDASYVVVTSDHGEELYEHGFWTHGFSLHHHQIHVPLIIRQPHGHGGGRRVPGLVELIDLMPTLLEVAGVSVPPLAQGTDLTPLLTNSGAAATAASFASAVRGKPSLYGLRTERYSLIVNFDDDSQTRLFDLEDDPGEQRNIARHEPRLAGELRQRLERHVAEQDRQTAPQLESMSVPEDMRKQLEALGYLR